MENNIKLYGQAEYNYAVSREILCILVNKDIITEEQRQRIDDLNRKTIYDTYPSVEDCGMDTLCSGGTENAKNARTCDEYKTESYHGM